MDDIITSSRQMEVIKERIAMIADTDSSVLIYGETGTGKELVAQSIHTSSRRKNKRFVSQNCASIPENLLESILFGTVKGSYTGAENRPGLFEMAAGGTLFLDEINSMETSVQAKLCLLYTSFQQLVASAYRHDGTGGKLVGRADVDGGGDIGRQLFDPDAVGGYGDPGNGKAVVAEDVLHRQISRIFRSHVADVPALHDTCLLYTSRCV